MWFLGCIVELDTELWLSLRSLVRPNPTPFSIPEPERRREVNKAGATELQFLCRCSLLLGSLVTSEFWGL